MREFVSHKAAQFKESVIREMSRVAAKHKAVNLAQGFPDFPAPREGALRYKCLYLYKAARKAEVFAGWRYMCV